MSQRHDYDWIVIGSGFGGSVAALRLAQKGYRVLVLESGRRFRDEDFAKSTWDTRRYFFAPKLGCRGIMRMSLFRDIFIVSGAGVGGGSLGYANTLYRARRSFFQDAGLGRPGRLGARARPALRHGRADARRHGRDLRHRRRPAAEGDGGGLRRRRHLPPHARGRLLRRERRRAPRPVLRRRGPGPQRLHALRAVHGRLPAQREEHAREELPVVRREARRARRARPHRDRRAPARRRGRVGRLRGHARAHRRVGAARVAADHRRRRRGRRRRARHEQAARDLPRQRGAPAPLRSHRPSRAHEQRVDRRRHRARRHARPLRVGGDQREHVPRPRDARRARHVRRGRRLDVDALHDAHRRRQPLDALARLALRRRAAPRPLAAHALAGRLVEADDDRPRHADDRRRDPLQGGPQAARRRRAADDRAGQPRTRTRPTSRSPTARRSGSPSAPAARRRARSRRRSSTSPSPRTSSAARSSRPTRRRASSTATGACSATRTCSSPTGRRSPRTRA